MKPITIRYRPISFIPIYRTLTGKFPKNWGEISAKQLIAIARLYKNHTTDVEFLSAMSGIGKRIFKRCDDYELYKLMEHLEFVGDRKAYHEFILSYISQKRYKLFLLETHFFAPGAKLKGVTFAQFIFADTYFSNYQESQNDDDLNKFIASLYLRNNEKFEEKLIQRNFKYIARIDRSIREAIAINWQLIHEWLSLAYPLIFQKHEEIIAEGTDTTCRVPGDYSSPWIKIFQNFVGDDILHNDQWADMPVNTIFQFMTRKYKENARRK